MGIGDLIDGAIAPFAPAWARERIAARAGIEANRIAMQQVRGYDAAGRGRRTKGWKRESSGANSEIDRARTVLAGAGHDLVRNNKYAASAVRQLVATIWGDGISAQVTHPVKRIQQRAQDELDRWTESKVDGHGDWYGHGKVMVREMIVGGESLTLWRPDANGPNGRVSGIEGSQLDMSRTVRLDRGRIIQGVELDESGDRTGYWIFDEHPNDLMPVMTTQSQRRPAVDIDHLYERLRFGQVRGVSWLGAVAMTLRDVADIEDAMRLQSKVQACLALVVQEGDTGSNSPLLGEQNAPQGDDGRKPMEETVRPGGIIRLRSGQSATVINPTPSASNVDFIRQQIAAVSANMVPYHLMTGDVSQANYSGLRAAMNGSYALVDDWQQNEVIPLLCRPMVMRRMERLAMETGDLRYLAVRPGFALPVRRLVDPIKDLMGEIMEIRAGLKTISRGLAERGINADDHLAEIARMNALVDKLGLALDSDPRRVTDSGVLQAATGYLAPKGEATN